MLEQSSNNYPSGTEPEGILEMHPPQAFLSSGFVNLFASISIKKEFRLKILVFEKVDL